MDSKEDELLDREISRIIFEEKKAKIKKLVDQYLKEVIYPFFPNFNYVKPGDIIQNSHRLLFGAVLDYSYTNDSLADSDYYYAKDDLKFIHYTSISNLLNIIREKSFRLYSLSSMKADPKELHFAVNRVLPNVTDKILEQWKNNVFCLSLTENEIEGTSDSFELWRNYGEKGKGVGIVVKFSDNNRFNWFNRHLSKVYYGEENLLRFQKFVDANFDFFTRVQDPIIGNFQELILNICCFHKTQIHKTEHEVRYIETKGGFLDKIYPNENFDSILCEDLPKMFVRLKSHKTTLGNSSDINFDIKPEIDIKSNGEIVFFSRLYIDRRIMVDKIETDVSCPHLKKMLIDMIPEIEIDEIILGHQYSEKEVEDIKIVINELTNNHLGKAIKVKQTELKQFF